MERHARTNEIRKAAACSFNLNCYRFISPEFQHYGVFIMRFDPNLCMSYDRKVVVPFHHFVKPNSEGTSIAPRCSFNFLRLPVDLQLTVYEHCDAPTLFQLMRTCSSTRRAVAKRFWETTFFDQWYHCLDDWLFQRRIRTFTIIPHCPEFASRIINVEIDLVRLELRFSAVGEEYDGRVPESTIAQAKDFWAKIEMVFPAVKRVVLTGHTPTRAEPPPAGESDEEYAIIETVVNCAPDHIKVYVAFVANSNHSSHEPPQYTLWCTKNQLEPAWKKLDKNWRPTRVLLPDRKWAISPLGDYQTFNRRYHSMLLEARGLEWLMVESYARYAVQGTIHCPRLDCSETYIRRDLWEQHLFLTGHGHFDIRHQFQSDPMLQLFCYGLTPETERLAIEARQQRLDAQYEETRKIEQRIGYGWGPPSSEQRRSFEKNFIAQLELESLYTPETPGPEEMSPVDRYLDGLWMLFHRGHIYHGHSCAEDGHICYSD